MVMPPWCNIYLLLAMCLSMGLHFVILYVDVLATIFQLAPLNLTEWMAVMKFSLPVILIDEILKVIARKFIDGKLKDERGLPAMNLFRDTLTQVMLWLLYFAWALWPTYAPFLFPDWYPKHSRPNQWRTNIV